MMFLRVLKAREVALKMEKSVNSGLELRLLVVKVAGRAVATTKGLL